MTVLQSSSFASPQANDYFWLNHLWTAIESGNFKDFIKRAANAIIAHGQFSLATSYKMYSVSSPTKYGNFTGNLIHISVIRRLFSLTLFRKLKIHQFVRKNSQDAGVNRAKKGYHCIIFFYTKEVTDCPLIVSNPRVSL